MPLLFGMTTITGTAAGGLADTQECMDFCAKNNIVPETELVRDSTDISANKKVQGGWRGMSHRKRRETKQQPSMFPGSAVPGCCLVSFCFLFDIHSIL